MGGEESKPEVNAPASKSSRDTDSVRFANEENEAAILSFNQEVRDLNNDFVETENATSKQISFLDEIEALDLLIARKQNEPLYARTVALEAVEKANQAAKFASQSAMVARLFAGMSDVGTMVKNASAEGANWALAKDKPADATELQIQE